METRKSHGTTRTSVRPSAVAALGLMATLLLPGQGAAAKDIYVAQTALGANSGTDAVDAHGSAWFNAAANWGAGGSQINPGDTVHLVGTFTNALNLNGGGLPGAPTTIYFEPNANITMPAIPATGGINCGNNNYLTIDGGVNGLIQSTSNGTGLAHAGTSVGVLCGDGNRSLSGITVQNLTITNLYNRTAASSEVSPAASGIQFFGNLTNVLVRNCSVSWCSTSYFFIYKPGVNYGLECCSNTATHCNWGICVGQGNAGASLGAVSLHHNRINLGTDWEDPADNYHHDGIFTFATDANCQITNLAIHDNIVGPYFGTHVTAAVYVSSVPSGIQNLLIYNNILFTSTNSAPSNGFIFVNGGVNCWLYNNTLDANNQGGMGIQAGTGANILIGNNIVSGMYYPIVEQTAGIITGCDDNLYWYNGGPMYFYQAGGFYFLNQWMGWGYDTHAITASPGFNNEAGFDFSLQPGSAAMGTGANESAWFTTDITGAARPTAGAWDIGAYNPPVTLPPPPPAPTVTPAPPPSSALPMNARPPSPGVPAVPAVPATTTTSSGTSSPPNHR